MIAERHRKRFIYSRPTGSAHSCVCLSPLHLCPFALRTDAACYAAVTEGFKMSPNEDSKERELIDHAQAFENTSTNVAAAQMRNALTNLAETVEDPKEKKVSSTGFLGAKRYGGFANNANRLFSCSRPRWTTSLLSSDDTSTTRPREMPCMFSLPFPYEFTRWKIANGVIATGTALPLPPRARSSTTRTSPTLSPFSS